MAHEMTQTALTARVHFDRSARSNSKFVLDVALDFDPGVAVIFGPSGAGKSTLLDCVAGLLRPQRGKITVSGETLFETDAGIDTRPERRHIGYVFQSLALFPHMTAAGNVKYGLASLSPEEQNQRVDEILTAFRIEALRSRKPHELSGGEQQRVALARAIVSEPKIVLADEPTGNLDTKSSEAVLGLLRQLNQDLGQTIVMITHNPEAAAYGHRVLHMRDGEVVDGSSVH